jgi:hypothetical protein
MSDIQQKKQKVNECDFAFELLYNNYIDDEDLDNSKLKKTNSIHCMKLNKFYSNIKKELKKRNISSFNLFESKINDVYMLDILYDNKCNSIEYIEEYLKTHNIEYNDSIFYILEIPTVFNYVFTKFGKYGINGYNISSFIQCCEMDFFYLAKMISNMIRFTKKDIKSIFSQFCIKVMPKYTEMLACINKEACTEVTNDGIILDNIIIFIKQYLESIENNPLRNKLTKDKQNDFNRVIKLFTNLNSNNIYFYKNNLLVLNNYISNISLATLNINKYMYLRSKKLESLDEISIFSEEYKNKLSNIPIKDDLCIVCYEKKPNIITLCKNEDIISKHQFCNSCISTLLLNVMPCPMCRTKICIDSLYCITTDIRKI